MDDSKSADRVHEFERKNSYAGKEAKCEKKKEAIRDPRPDSYSASAKSLPPGDGPHRGSVGRGGRAVVQLKGLLSTSSWFLEACSFP